MKKTIVSVLVLLMLIGVSACTQKTDEGTKTTDLVNGTYTATKEGFQHEHVSVSVTIEDSKITAVNIDEITDFPVTVIEAPVKEIPAAILEHQTYNVDSVTGATLTSNAIKQAVKDCLDQAGGSDLFSHSVEHPEKINKEDVQTDVLVVGAGGAGVMAAIEASIGSSVNESSGLNVMLIEKAGFIGGNTSVSGGVRYLYEDETGSYDQAWVDASLTTEKTMLQPYMELAFNEELMRHEIEINPYTNQLLEDIGVKSKDNWGYKAFDTNDGHVDPKWSGSYFTYAVKPYLEKTSIDLRLNTEAVELLQDEAGAVIGVKVTDNEGTYNIYAKKVVLATGGFAHNRDLIEKYAPEFTKGIVFAAGTNTGDGIVMAEAIGAQIIGDKMFGHIGADAIEGARPDYGGSIYYGSHPVIYINMNGQRFVNEDKNKYVIYHDLLNQPEQTGWGIVDGDNINLEPLKNSSSSHVVHADTLEELAELIKVDKTALLETVNKYNEDVKNGEDTQFNVSPDRLDVIDQAPYYAYTINPITFSSMVSVKVDEDCRVLNKENQVIENLFAAGDMVLGGNITSYYFDARGVGTAMYTGTICGQTAKDEIINLE